MKVLEESSEDEDTDSEISLADLVCDDVDIYDPNFLLHISKYSDRKDGSISEMRQD